MASKRTVTRALALIGTVLVWLPLAAPFVLGFIALFTRGEFLFDYLMPAELALLVVIGGALLLWTALRVGSRLRMIGGSLGTALLMLVGSQGLAFVTGLASGDTATGGWEWVLVLLLLALYVAAVAMTGVGGVLLVRDLATPARPHSAS